MCKLYHYCKFSTILNNFQVKYYTVKTKPMIIMLLVCNME